MFSKMFEKGGQGIFSMAEWLGNNIYNEWMLKRMGIHDEWVARQMYNIQNSSLTFLNLDFTDS